MYPNLTTEQMIEVDRLMVEEYGILLIQMMENAGRHLAEQAWRMLDGDLPGKVVVVLCGAGNNGGGGMVAARHLHNRGASVWVQLASDPARLKDVPARQWQILEKIEAVASGSLQLRSGVLIDRQATHAQPETGSGLPVGLSALPDRPALVIDALIGYGLRGNPGGWVATWIAWANGRACPILALDAPSGLDATSGTPGQPCIRATTTLTLALPKGGLRTQPAAPYVGKLFLADISVPPELYRQIGLEVGPIFSQGAILEVS